MHDPSERLRRMTEYGWHMLRADCERERATLCRDMTVRQLHDELAGLHASAAESLSEAWHNFDVQECSGAIAAEQTRHAYESLFVELYGPARFERAQALIPAALFSAA